MSDTRASESTSPERDPPSLLGRLLFGGMLAVAAINGFRGMEEQIAYAESKDVRYANYLVPFSNEMLAFGSVGTRSGGSPDSRPAPSRRSSRR